MFIVEPLAGLGNRLYAFVSAYVLSEKYQHQLEVLWNNDSSFAANMEDVLDVPGGIRVYHVTEDSIYRAPFRAIYSKLVRKHFHKKAVYYVCGKDWCALPEEVRYKKVQEVVASSTNVYIRSWARYVEKQEMNFACIKPSEKVKKRGARLFELIDKNTYGIHIRRTDHVNAIENSPIGLFEDKIESIRVQDSDAKFYIATDDYETRNYLKSKFGECIISYDQGVLSRTTKTGAIDAAVELFALSKCKKIFGSFDSTYSQTAALIGGIDLDVLRIDEIRKE